MDWIEIVIYTNTDGIEPVSGRLYQLGITGIQVLDALDFEEFLKSNVRAWDCVDENLEKSMEGCETCIKAYVSSLSALETVNSVKKSMDELRELGDFGRLEVKLNNVKDEDWADNWKQYYKPLRIGEKMIIKPSWEKADIKDGDLVIELDPGMAFGTGTHESTRMCVELLEKYIKPGDTVLDIGTGSGILSIAALKLGAKSVIAVDIDPLAVKIGKENGAINGFTEPQLTFLEGDLLDKVSGKFDVVIANIIADIIVPLCDNVKSFMAEGCIFITSGIINYREADIINAMEKNEIHSVCKKELNDWIAIVGK